MASKSVEILIEADNQASKKLKEVQQDLGRQVKGIQQAGQKAKASTELVGTFAAAFGGSEIAGFASEIAQMSDRVREFGEVGKQGRVAALAFKGALVAGVAVAAFKIGQAIGNIVFQTEKWNRELEEAAERSNRLASSLVATNQELFATAREEIEIIRDPEEKKRQLEELFGTITSNMGAAQVAIRRAENDLEALNDEWHSSDNDDAMIADAKRRIAQQRAILDVYEQQRSELNKQLDPAHLQFEEQKKLFDLRNKSDDYLQSLRDELEVMRATKEEAIAIEAARNTQGSEAQEEAERLLRERDAILAKAEAEKEAVRVAEQAEKDKAKAAEQAAKQRADAAKKVADIERGALQNLQRQVIEMAKGEEAARSFDLQMQGIDRETADRIANAEAKIGRLQEMQTQTVSQDPGQVSAIQGRLLSRGSGSNLAGESKRDEAARIAKEQRDLQKAGNELLRDLKESIDQDRQRSSDELKVTVVS